MVKITLALFLLVAVAAAAIEAASVPGKTIPRERPDFIFLGSTKREVLVKVHGITSVTYEDWNYWISANSAGYAEAQRDCRANGDALVQIETMEELKLVTEFLQDTDQSASFVWVGGNYDSSSKTLAWESGDAILAGMWARGQPSQQKPNSRVAAGIVGQIIQLKSQASTQTTRYICEGK